MLPATLIQTFGSFLFCLFVIACGLTCLETAANPYTTVLGPSESGARRINFSQSFNGLGWIAGPLVRRMLIFSVSDNTNKFASIALPYLLIGTLVLIVAFLFWRVKFPEIKEEADFIAEESSGKLKDLLKHPHFVLAVVAQFLYVAAQTGVNSFFINYVTETMTGVRDVVSNIMTHLGGFGRVFMPKNPEQAASVILALGGMGSFWIGRLSGAWFMKFVSPGRLLAIYGLC